MCESYVTINVQMLWHIVGIFCLLMCAAYLKQERSLAIGSGHGEHTAHRMFCLFLVKSQCSESASGRPPLATAKVLAKAGRGIWDARNEEQQRWELGLGITERKGEVRRREWKGVPPGKVQGQY